MISSIGLINASHSLQSGSTRVRLQTLNPITYFLVAFVFKYASTFGVSLGTRTKHAVCDVESLRR